MRPSLLSLTLGAEGHFAEIPEQHVGPGGWEVCGTGTVTPGSWRAANEAHDAYASLGRTPSSEDVVGAYQCERGAQRASESPEELLIVSLGGRRGEAQVG